VELTEAAPVVITHHEGQELRTHGGETVVQRHMEAPIVKQHVEAPIVKKVHQNVIHEHHKDILHEHRENILHEHTQPVIHEVHQPIIHEKHIHEIHKPIIHEKHQTIVSEQHQQNIQEEQRHLVHEQTKDAVIHERVEKPVLHCDKDIGVVKGASTSQTMHTHTHATNLPATTTTQQTITKDVIMSEGGDVYESGEFAGQPKQSFGQKIKGIFTGKSNDAHIHHEPHGTLHSNPAHKPL
jgi:hypothetical protein